IDGVLIQRRMMRRAETQRGIGDFQPFGGNVLFVGEIDAEAALLALGSLRGQDTAELQVPRLVVGGIGVGDVVGQHLGTLGPKAQRLLVNPQCLVETDAHALAPLPDTGLLGKPSARAVPSRQSIEIQGDSRSRKPPTVKKRQVASDHLPLLSPQPTFFCRPDGNYFEHSSEYAATWPCR